MTERKRFAREWLKEQQFQDHTVYNFEGVPVCVISDLLTMFGQASAREQMPTEMEIAAIANKIFNLSLTDGFFQSEIRRILRESFEREAGKP